MGVWGFKNFENDDALDWAAELVEQSDKHLVICALKEIVNNDDYLEVPECCEGLCAVNIIACIKDNQFAGLPKEVIDWLQEVGDLEFNDADINLAKDALNRIMTESELKELWEETDDFEEWMEYLDGISDCLRYIWNREYAKIPMY